MLSHPVLSVPVYFFLFLFFSFFFTAFFFFFLIDTDKFAVLILLAELPPSGRP